MPEKKAYSKHSGKEIAEREYDETKIAPYLLASVRTMDDASELLELKQSFMIRLDSDPSEFINEYGQEFEEHRIIGKNSFSCKANFDYVLRLSKNQHVKSIDLNKPVKYY